MQRSIRLGVMMLAMTAGHAAVAQAPARPGMVLREAVGGMPRGEVQDIHVMTAVIQPGQSTVFHTHRFPVTVHLLEGSFTLEMEARAPATIAAGQSMVGPPHVRMTGHNRSASEPIRPEIVHVSDPGGPFLDPIH